VPESCLFQPFGVNWISVTFPLFFFFHPGFLLLHPLFFPSAILKNFPSSPVKNDRPLAVSPRSSACYPPFFQLSPCTSCSSFFDEFEFSYASGSCRILQCGGPLFCVPQTDGWTVCFSFFSSSNSSFYPLDTWGRFFCLTDAPFLPTSQQTWVPASPQSHTPFASPNPESIVTSLLVCIQAGVLSLPSASFFLSQIENSALSFSFSSPCKWRSHLCPPRKYLSFFPSQQS